MQGHLQPFQSPRGTQPETPVAQLLPLGPRLGPISSLYNINRISKYTWKWKPLGTQQAEAQSLQVPSRSPGPGLSVQSFVIYREAVHPRDLLKC